MLTREERARMLSVYGTAHEKLTEMLKGFPKEMWEYRSPFDPWTIHEIIVHIADSEANSYVRCRRCIAEPGKDVMAYDENVWAKELDYFEQSTDDALELFKSLRGNTFKLLLTLQESDWAKTIFHPENGVMTLDDWLGVYERHVQDHLEQMTHIHEHWLSGDAR